MSFSPSATIMALVTPSISFRSSETPSSWRRASFSASMRARYSCARLWISAAVSSSKPSMAATSPEST
jgi:hypothetical protein